MAGAKPILLGNHNGKEYYLVPATSSTPEHFAWSVPDIRSGIIARPGWKILVADYSQIEVRIMAWLSQDPWLIAAINSGKDVHCFMAASVNGIDYDDFMRIYKDETHELHTLYVDLRSEIKTTTFGIPYGAGPGQIAKQINENRPKENWITEEDAIAIIEKYFAKAPRLKQYLKDQGIFGLSEGYSRSIMGHHRFYRVPTEGHLKYDELISQIKRWSTNHPIQSSSADMLKMALGKIYLDLRGGLSYGPLIHNAHLILVVHDEIVMTAEDKDVEAVAKIMENGMQWAYNSVIGLDNIIHNSEVKISSYWAKG